MTPPLPRFACLSLLLFLSLLYFHCSSDDGGGAAMFDYVCENGTPSQFPRPRYTEVEV